MNILTFTYTKKPDDTPTSRVVIPLICPTDKYFCIDVSDLSEEDQALFAAEVAKVDAEKQEKINELMNKYDVRTNFRSFIPGKMSNIEVE